MRQGGVFDRACTVCLAALATQDGAHHDEICPDYRRHRADRVALARNLLAHGWSVRVVHRGGHTIPDDLVQAGATEVIVDRQDRAALLRAAGGGADAVINRAAFGPEHASSWP